MSISSPPPLRTCQPSICFHLAAFLNDSAIGYKFPEHQDGLPPLRETTLPPRPAWIRAPGRLQNTFANECFLDEIAAAAGDDPLHLRVRYTDPGDKRGLEVLDRLAKLAKWDERASPQKSIAGNVVKGRGCAYVRYELHRTYVGAVAEVEVDRAMGDIRVVRFTIVHDCGQIISANRGIPHPDLEPHVKGGGHFRSGHGDEPRLGELSDSDLSRSARDCDRADRPTDRTAVGRRRTLERHGPRINLERRLRRHRRAPSLGAIYATEGEGSLGADLSFTTKGTVYRTATTEMRPLGHQSSFMPRRADFLVELSGLCAGRPARSNRCKSDAMKE